MVHSSETGECPSGQCILYASTLLEDNAKERLEAAVDTLIHSPTFSRSPDPATPESAPRVLYTVYYEQGCASTSLSVSDGLCSFPSSSLDLAFDDAMLDHVEGTWKAIVGVQVRDEADEASGSGNAYMVFEEREGMQADDEDMEDV